MSNVIAYLLCFIVFSYLIQYVYHSFFNKDPNADQRATTCWTACAVSLLLMIEVSK